MLDKAIRIAAVAFEGKFDKSGAPYILHCLHVMNTVGPEDHDLMAIAVLHDLVEDTEWTLQDLRDEGFPSDVVTAISILTHEDGVDYEDYIRSISDNNHAVKVKRADLQHNSDIMRMKGLRRKDFQRLEKYHKAYEYLKDL